jgi:periplasmic protein TonB
LSSQQVLVALVTGEGVVYAPASGWDRVCLLWTFRNFRSLPQNVLSPRQQRLIGSLYCRASGLHPHELDPHEHEPVVVGTVEDFRPSDLSTLPSSGKIQRLVAYARGARLASVRALGRKPFHARFGNRMTLPVGMAALVIAIAVLAWHQLGAQPVASAPSPQTIANNVMTREIVPTIVEPAPSPATATPSAIPPTGNSAQAETATAHMGTAAPAVQRSEVPPTSSLPRPITASPVRTLAPASKYELNDSAANSHRPAPASPKVASLRVYEATADQPRMQISGRPRKLVYPVCPETQARGKVSLQAVVGYDGAVSRVRVLTGDHALAAAAVEAVRQWRYEPFSDAAPRLERETNITISFISNEVVAVSFPNSSQLSR